MRGEVDIKVHTKGQAVKIARVEDANGRNYMLLGLLYADRNPQRDESWNSVGRRYDQKGIKSRIKELEVKGTRVFYQDSKLEEEINAILER